MANLETQKIFLSYMLDDPELFLRSQSILNFKHWDQQVKNSLKYILTYTEQYKSLPSREQIYAETNTQIPTNSGVLNREWYLDNIEKFSRYQAMKEVILDSVDLLDEEKYSEIEKRIKEAISISLQRTMGINYWDSPLNRLEGMLQRDNMVPTYYDALDTKLYGGFSKGSLNIFAANSGVGKSLWLQNLTLNWALNGLNVIYISLELSEELIALRLDTMFTETPTKEIFKNLNSVALKVALQGKQAGRIQVVKMPEAGTTTNTLRSLVKEFEIQNNVRPDVLVVDYLDLMYPNDKKIDSGNLFIKDKFVCEELRALAGELDIPLVTASQFNRGSVEKQGDSFSHSDIAGGMSKVNTADNLFGIHATQVMKINGKMQLEFLKVRSSGCTGDRLTFGYDPNTMRILNVDETITDPNNQNSNNQPILQNNQSSSILDKIKLART
jgi:archaellum biogenesis ATPase FlaH